MTLTVNTRPGWQQSTLVAWNSPDLDQRLHQLAATEAVRTHFKREVIVTATSGDGATITLTWPLVGLAYYTR